MPSYVARPHVLANKFVPGYLGDSFGLLPFVHGNPLANHFDGPLRAAGLGAPLYSRANDWQTRRAYGFIFRGLFKISLCGFFITGRVFPDLH